MQSTPLLTLLAFAEPGTDDLSSSSGGSETPPLCADQVVGTVCESHDDSHGSVAPSLTTHPAVKTALESVNDSEDGEAPGLQNREPDHSGCGSIGADTLDLVPDLWQCQPCESKSSSSQEDRECECPNWESLEDSDLFEPLAFTQEHKKPDLVQIMPSTETLIDQTPCFMMSD